LGVVIAASFVFRSAAANAAALRSESGGYGHRTPKLAVAALVLLRWIPLPAHVGRELVLLALAATMVWLLRSTPFAMLFAVTVVLITPAVPLRTLALPLAMTGAVFLARFFQMPRIALTVPSLFVLACMLTFFAWSGVLARGFPYFAHSARESPRRDVLNLALAPSRSVVLDVPSDATALIVSGANVARFRRGTLLGTIEPGAIPIRIGDGSDWGYMRRDFFYGGHNPLPVRPAGMLRGYGYDAWVDGAGLVTLPPRARTIRVTADANLPRDGSLQVEGFALR
jgi:hypothetical protein